MVVVGLVERDGGEKRKGREDLFLSTTGFEEVGRESTNRQTQRGNCVFGGQQKPSLRAIHLGLSSVSMSRGLLVPPVTSNLIRIRKRRHHRSQ